MARESRRRREARKFGVPERLADMILNTPPERWKFPTALAAQEAIKCIAAIQVDVARSPVIDAENVKDYFYEHPQEYWTYSKDFPSSAPPFDRFFIEFRKPRRCVVGDTILPTDPSCPDRLGFLFDAVDARGRDFPKPRGVGPMVGFDLVPLPEARWFFRAAPILADADARPIYLSFVKYWAVDATGRIIADPNGIQSGIAPSARTIAGLDAEISQFFMPALLAISFMNCRNVTVRPRDPDPAINAERLRAGRKPFVRYHVIDIEPMRRVLRDEGGSEHVGLKRALHICRGHFATYTEDRPLFGRVAGTVWRPAHVRGTLDAGVVVADYRVAVPAVGEP